MNSDIALDLASKIIKQVFGRNNPWTLEQIFEKFALDVKLPQKVTDIYDGSTTFCDHTNASSFISQAHVEKYDTETGWLRKKRDLQNLDDLLKAWQEINPASAARQIDSLNIAESDTSYGSENLFRCSNTFHSKNLVFCDTMSNAEFCLASSRSTASYCIRTDDSGNCSNSYSVIFSNQIINSFFIQDCFDLTDCMFCSHIACQRFCIANMQFTEAEYNTIKAEVINWIMQD